MTSTPVPVLLLTGTVGAGKTTVAFEISDVLSEREIPNGAIDCDLFTAQWPATSTWNRDLLFECVAAVWPVYRAHGTDRLVLANVYEDPTDVDRFRDAIPGAEITVCRVVAPHDLRLARLRARMPEGPSLDWHLHRTGELHEILEQAAYEDFTVANGDRPVREVAVEVLRRAGWI